MDKSEHKAPLTKKTIDSTNYEAYQTLRQGWISYVLQQLFSIGRGNRDFFTMIIALTLIAALITPYPSLARWFAFMIAGYSAIANDSIQTLGTLIACHGNKKWWYLWLFIGSIFVATVLYSWFAYHGDVSYQLLNGKGLSEAPHTFSFFQLFAPIVLLLLTRWRIPVSTSFLLLNVFATEADTILHVLSKSFYGYFIAFISGFVCWIAITRISQKHDDSAPWRGWISLQWIASGGLWSAWIMQDTSNIAVFLPRPVKLDRITPIHRLYLFWLRHPICPPGRQNAEDSY